VETAIKPKLSLHPKRRNISLAIMDYSASMDNTKDMSLKYTLDGDAGIDLDGSNSFTDILLPIPYCLFPIAYSLFPIPCSLFPISYSLFPIPYSLFPILTTIHIR